MTIDTVIYDLIIVGASPEGIKVSKELNDTKKQIALISTDFPPENRLKKLTNISLLCDTVTFVTYNHGLIQLGTRLKKNLFCKNILFTVGVTPELSAPSPKGVYYSTNRLIADKKKQAIVVGQENNGIHIALQLSKKFKYVYLIDKQFNIIGDSKECLMINQTPNIAFLPNSEIINYRFDKTGILKSVKTSAFGEISTDTVVIATHKIPDTRALQSDIIKLNSSGYIQTTDLFIANRNIPVFALGNCIEQNNSGSAAAFITYIKERLQITC